MSRVGDWTDHQNKLLRLFLTFLKFKYFTFQISNETHFINRFIYTRGG
jgi:hypothetical protein